jgi:lyso-ornithine lipid O-acyltransferase
MRWPDRPTHGVQRRGGTVANDWTELIRPPGLPSRIKVAAKLAGFMAFTLPLMPVQAAFVAYWPSAARRFPHWYHKRVCRLLGVRVKVEGQLARNRPVLVIANHSSWLDIPVISAAAPVSFVAKKEVASWPFVSWLAKLQRTVFVDRNRRTTVGDTAGEMIERLALGDALVLFAEGTSSDGSRVLPFKTSLLAAAKPSRGATKGDTPVEDAAGKAVVQTLALVYTRQHGLTIDKAHRHLVGWYGDMELAGHVLALIENCPIDVTVRLSEPVPLEDFQDRKALARFGETSVRAQVVELLRGR